MATVGEEFLNEMQRKGKRYDYFSYEQFQVIKEVDSLATLSQYLDAVGFGPLRTTENVQEFADDFIKRQAEKQVDTSERNALLYCGLQPATWFLLPLLLPFMCVRHARDKQGRIQFSLVEIFMLATVVGLAVTFQTAYPAAALIGSRSFFTEWQKVVLIHALPSLLLGLACGGIGAALLKRGLWWRIGMTVFVEVELIAIVVAFASKM